MNSSHAALVVPANLNQPVYVRLVEFGGQAFQGRTLGSIESIIGGDWLARLMGGDSATAPNVRAEVLIREAGIDLDEALYGTAIFLGLGNADVETDIPRHLIKLAEQLFGMPLAA